jgi:hypothetical protein
VPPLDLEVPPSPAAVRELAGKRAAAGGGETIEGEVGSDPGATGQEGEQSRG